MASSFSRSEKRSGQSGEFLVVLTPEDHPAARAAREQLKAAGGHVKQTYGPAVLIVEVLPELMQLLESHPGVVGVYREVVPDKFLDRVDKTGQLGIATWNERHKASYREAKKQRKGEGLPWDHPAFDREG